MRWVLGEEWCQPEESGDESEACPVDGPEFDVCTLGFVSIVGELEGDEDSEEDANDASNTSHDKKYKKWQY